jgi:hypothetical protein
LDEPEPVDNVLKFLSGYDILEYSWVKATTISVRLRILFVTLQNTKVMMTPVEIEAAVRLPHFSPLLYRTETIVPPLLALAIGNATEALTLPTSPLPPS